jgi:hypothetical protein
MRSLAGSKSVMASGATRIFKPMGKLRLCKKKTMGKMGKIFVNGPNKILVTYKNQKD